jgi:hypothetical protein
MITNTGKALIAKYLIGQAPAYATYMGFGCGTKALSSTETFSDYSEKSSLEFEMFRAPIISRGYVNEDGEDKIVLTAQLPTEERYEITEIGVFSGAANPSALQNDSRNFILFNEVENWEYHSQDGALQIPFISQPFHTDPGNVISTTEKAFSVDSNNPTLSNSFRVDRQERPRFLNTKLIVRGDISDLGLSANISGVVSDGTSVTYTTSVPHTLVPGTTGINITGITPTQYNLPGVTIASVPSPTTFTVSQSGLSGDYVSGGSVTTKNLVIRADSDHVHRTGFNVNLNRSSPIDEIRFAFSVLNKNGTLDNEYPDRVILILDFSDVDSTASGEFARMQIDLSNGTGGIDEGEWDWAENRFAVAKSQIQELYQTPLFNWANVEVVKIFACVIKNNQPSENFYVAMNGIRFENKSSISPIYGMSAYSEVQTPAGNPLVKDLNTSNLSEFRFGIDLGA